MVYNVYSALENNVLILFRCVLLATVYVTLVHCSDAPACLLCILVQRRGRLHWNLFSDYIFQIISASKPNRKAVRRADALLKTNYVTSDVCDQKCTGPTNARVVRCLSWKSISVPRFGRDYWHGGRANNSNKTTNNSQVFQLQGVESCDMTSAYKFICDSRHFEFCLHFEFYFYPFSVSL